MQSKGEHGGYAVFRENEKMTTDQERAAALEGMPEQDSDIESFGAWVRDNYATIRALLTEPRPETVTVEEFNAVLDARRNLSLSSRRPRYETIAECLSKKYPHGCIILKDKSHE